MSVKLHAYLNEIEMILKMIDIICYDRQEVPVLRMDLRDRNVIWAQELSEFDLWLVSAGGWLPVAGTEHRINIAHLAAGWLLFTDGGSSCSATRHLIRRSPKTRLRRGARPVYWQTINGHRYSVHAALFTFWSSLVKPTQA